MAKILPIGHLQSLQLFDMAENINKVLVFYTDMQRDYIGKNPRITENRKKHIDKLLKKHTVEELCLVIEYICTGKDHYATWMRENNYASFSNMFRVKKIADKLVKAKEWHQEQTREADEFNKVNLPFILGD